MNGAAWGRLTRKTRGANGGGLVARARRLGLGEGRAYARWAAGARGELGRGVRGVGLGSWAASRLKGRGG
jgi:hypothetical protein